MGRPKKAMIYDFFCPHIKIINGKCFPTWKMCISRRYYKIFITKNWEIRGYSKFARGPKKKGFAVISAARLWINRNKKKGGNHSLMTMLRMDEEMWKIFIFRKMADLEIQNCLFDQNFTHIFGYRKKITVQKKILRPSEGQLYIETSEKNFKLIGQAVLKLQWSPTLKTWFREKRV